MLLKWQMLLLVLMLLLAFATGWWARDALAAIDRMEEAARQAQAMREAVAGARAEEQRLQKVTNDALEKQARDSARVAANLAAELHGLRDRAERAERMSADSRAACAGADGRELSRPDAEFLARLAARADEQRAALSACYAVLDGLQNDRKK